MKPEYQIYCILLTGLSPRKDPFPTLEEAEVEIDVMPPLSIYERGYTILPVYKPTEQPKSTEPKVLKQIPVTVTGIELSSNAAGERIALNLRTPEPPKRGDFIVGQ